MTTIYEEVYRRSQRDPEGFWGAVAEDVYWERRWDRVLDSTRPPYYRWFAGGVLNTCYNALDVHIDRGRGKQPALIYDSPVTGTARVFTYFELRDAVDRFAGALRRPGGGRRGPASRARCDGRASSGATGSSSTCPWCRRR